MGGAYRKIRLMPIVEQIFCSRPDNKLFVSAILKPGESSAPLFNLQIKQMMIF